MVGEKEQRCLNTVIRSLNSEGSLKKYFGLLKNDIDEINDILKTAESNEKLSEFPDFVFKNGFIEHFQITSSKANKDGAKQLEELSRFKNKVEKATKILEEEWNDNPDCNKIRSESWAMKYPKHSYEYLCDSFKKSWENHIESYNKYTGNKHIGVFMIEYSDLALTMYENVYADWIYGMVNGDFREPEKIQIYRLTRDKNLLKYIYSFKENLKYVFFVYGKDCEIIKLESIPYLLKLMPWDYVIAPYIGTTLVSSLYNLSIQNPIDQKGNLDNE